MIYYLTPEKWQRIPADQKIEHSDRYGQKACFICALTSIFNGPGTTLCYEKWHFVINGNRPGHTEAERRNGESAVACLTDKARRGAERAGNALTVWEYRGGQGERLQRFSLYAYQYGEEYANDLTENELIDFLETLSDVLDAPEAASLMAKGGKQ